MRNPVLRFVEAIAMKTQYLGPASAKSGDQGELLAYFYLRELGFTVVARQWRTSRLRGEIDLIAWEGNTLCFVEVKTRTARGLVGAESAVDEQKEKMLKRVAAAYLRQLPMRPGGVPAADTICTRFDVISVYLDSLPEGIELIRNAFA
ncbi:MAG: YraN family protein [Acidobacteria bacterium]|nr:YraN family protein [Acidobacteriota bacterium]